MGFKVHVQRDRELTSDSIILLEEGAEKGVRKLLLSLRDMKEFGLPSARLNELNNPTRRLTCNQRTRGSRRSTLHKKKDDEQEQCVTNRIPHLSFLDLPNLFIINLHHGKVFHS